MLAASGNAAGHAWKALGAVVGAVMCPGARADSGWRESARPRSFVLRPEVRVKLPAILSDAEENGSSV
jgi:hypothetical protein